MLTHLTNSLILVLLISAIARPQEIATGDGLSIILSRTSGAVEGIRVDGKSLPVIAGQSGGISFSEALPMSPGSLVSYDFDSTGTVWTSAFNANWEATQNYVTWVASGGTNNSPHLRLGNGVTQGCGMAMPAPVAVVPGAQIRISWMGKVTNADTTYIICVRVYDGAGADITESVAAPSGWGYSTTSRAHYKTPITNSAADVWEQFSFDYAVSERAHFVRISLRHWQGGDHYVYVDDLRVDVIGGLSWSEFVNVAAPLEIDPTTTTVKQTGVISERSLRFEIDYLPQSDRIVSRLSVESTSPTVGLRRLKVAWSLPVEALNWWWWDDIATTRTIDAVSSYQNVSSVIGRPVSVYPFATISGEECAVALAVPMVPPQLQYFSYSREQGLRTEYRVCLSDISGTAPSWQAEWEFEIFRAEAAWGARSVLQKYYKFFPEYFVKRTARDGAWEYPIRPSQIPNPLDFGFRFFETWPQSAEERAVCAAYGIGIYHYIEPWLCWHAWGSEPEKPPYEERVAQLQAWAAETTSTATWLGVPQWYTAQAVLNSSPLDADGRLYIDALDYYWHEWAPGVYNQAFPVNADGGIGNPDTAKVYCLYQVLPRLDEAEGIYVDSITMSLFHWEDFRSEHLSASYLPLDVSARGGVAVELAPFAQYEFLSSLAGDLHARGKLVMGNIFSSSIEYRFYAAQLDILGSEVFELGESPALSRCRRTLSHHKINTNLLQWGWGLPTFITSEQMKSFIENSMFYGIFPGVSSAGGEMSGGAPNRYFLHPELYERDRPLFRLYIPVIRRLSDAGWEPLTFARMDDANVLIERFGAWTDNTLCFTLMNTSETTRTVSVAVDLAALGANIAVSKGSAQREQPKVVDMVSEETITNTMSEEPFAMRFSLKIAPQEVRAIAVERQKAKPVAWHFR
jgi:hypothetical protein